MSVVELHVVQAELQRSIGRRIGKKVGKAWPVEFLLGPTVVPPGYAAVAVYCVEVEEEEGGLGGPDGPRGELKAAPAAEPRWRRRR